ncbi:hypothetical protein [uncultured Catenibacterium sp.]|uniref:hypothetical protein n=1 Tax=uncultured Catenibacterium sp. TaxID=286142 RepID=UPI002598E178|nr:hypothetical protein [uncultured Catenibacterium sp.]
MKTKKILVEVVATAMIVAPLAQPARVFNVHALDTTPVVQTTTESPVLQNATVLIPSDATVGQVTEILNKAVIKNLDNVDTSSIEWEYQCEGKGALASKNTAWGSINGFESTKKVWGVSTTYTHPSLAANSDGSYQVRIKRNDTVVTVTKAAKLNSAIEVNQGVEVTLPYDEDANVNYDTLKENIFNSVVKSSNPKLTVNDVTIQYYATGKIIFDGLEKKDWTSLEGSKDTFTEYPAISEGTQKIKISYNGNDTYYGAEKEVNITVKDRTPSDITVNEGQTIKLAYNDDATVNYDKVREDIFNKVVESSTPDLTVDDVTIQYYASTKTLGVPSQAWVALEGGKDVVNYPAISEGAQTIRIIYKGSKDYKPRTVETTINVLDRATVDVVTNEGPYNVFMKFNKDQSYDYDATAKAIYEAVIKSTNPELSFEDFKVEYNPDLTGASDLVGGVWYELNNKNAFNLNKFKAGTWKIRLSWNATKEYKAGNIVVTVNVEDNRLESAVTLKEGTSVTYNMDAQEMKKALFKSIDFSKSTLPSKDELSVDDFTYEYFGTNVVAGNIDGGIKQWAPVEGGKVTLLDYPQMPAGEQKVRITYKGNSDYRPSTSGETTIIVKKAKVKVSVHSTNIFADEELSKDFITINPADKFDVYTVYAGATSNVSLGLYLDLPARFTDNEAVIKVLDPVVEKVFGKTFTQMMQDGVTVGELRKLFSTQELLDLLEKLHIDTGTFGQILKVINKLPGIADNVRVGFGTPNRPGLYAVTAVTDNKNYETGVGIGALLVKQHVKGVKLIWNQKLTKISKEEAQNFDFKATVTYNGAAVSDENVHYLYTGVQSNLKPYSSTTTAPTEPGVYTMTVLTLGGNYKAAPITRTFTITK